jgi:hypothetical protein
MSTEEKVRKPRARGFRYNLPTEIVRPAPEKTGVGKLAGNKLRKTKDRDVLVHVGDDVLADAGTRFSTSPAFLKAVIDHVYTGLNATEAFQKTCEESGLTGTEEAQVKLREGARAAFAAMGLYIPRYFASELKKHEPGAKAEATTAPA